MVTVLVLMSTYNGEAYLTDCILVTKEFQDKCKAVSS